MSHRSQVLRTKLHRPPITHDLVIRAKLIEYLEKNRQKPFTLVSAPAGYGKSILISQWIDKNNLKSCWISLDEEQNDLYTFLAYLTTGLSNLKDNSFNKIAGFLKSAELPPIKTI